MVTMYLITTFSRCEVGMPPVQVHDIWIKTDFLLSYELGLGISVTIPSIGSLLTVHTVQIAGVSIASDARLLRPVQYKKKVELIGGS